MTNTEVTRIVKNDGSTSELDLDKIHRMVNKACEGLSGVSQSLIEMNSGLQIYDGISTNEIQKILVKSSSDLISLENPNSSMLQQDCCYIQYRNRFLIPSGKILKYILISRTSLLGTYLLVCMTQPY